MEEISVELREILFISDPRVKFKFTGTRPLKINAIFATNPPILEGE